MDVAQSIEVPGELWNKFAVARSGETVTLAVPVEAHSLWVRVSRADALLLAAWIVLQCDQGAELEHLLSLLRLSTSSSR